MGAGLLQPTHVIFVIVIALLVFGPKRLPEMGRAVGQGIREFKGSIDGDGSESDPAVPGAQEAGARVSSVPAPAPLAGPAPGGAARAAQPGSSPSR